MGNLSVAHDLLNPECLELLGNWADALRAASDTVGRGSSSITVAGRLKIAAVGAPVLRSLCRELADSSGLRAEVTLDGPSFSVRFSKAVVAAV